MTEIIKKNEGNISDEVLGKNIIAGKFSKKLDINGLKINITIKR